MVSAWCGPRSSSPADKSSSELVPEGRFKEVVLTTGQGGSVAAFGADVA